jgi:hypothetical protein
LKSGSAARQIIDAIDISSIIGMRDRALIGRMFMRIGSSAATESRRASAIAHFTRAVAT